MKRMEFAKDWGEDRIFSDGRRFIVIDGCTPVNTQPCGAFHSTAEWMAENFISYAQQHPDDQDFAALCRDFLAETAEAPELKNLARTDRPCFAAAAVYLIGRTVRVWNLGDCSIYLHFCDDDLVTICDKRAETFSEKTLQAKADALAHGLDPSAAVAAQKAENRLKMNTQDGYWTVAYEGDVYNAFIRRDYHASTLQSFLLCSDGLSRGLDVEGGVTPITLLHSCEEYHRSRQVFSFCPDPLENTFRLVRSLEDAADEAHVKKHDDIAAIFHCMEYGC